VSRRPRWRRVARGLGLAALGLGGLGVLGLVLLATGPGNELLRRGVVRGFGALFPDAALQVQSLHSNLVDGLALRGVVISDAQGQALITADRLAVDWDLSGLLRGRIVLEAVHLDGPDLDLGSGPDGRLRLLQAMGGPPSPPGTPATAWQGLPVEIVVHALSIQGGDIHWDGGALRGLSLDTRGHVGGRTVELADLAGSAHLDGPIDADVGLTGALALIDGDLSLHELGLRLGHSRLSLSGLVHSIETAPDLDLSLRSPALLPEDLRLLTGAGAPAQALDLKGQVRGPASDLQAALQVQAGAGGSLALRAEADLAQARPAWRLVVQGAPVDVQALYPASLEQEVSARQLEVQVTGSGLSWPQELACYVQVQAQDAVLWDEAVPSLSARASLADGELLLDEARLVHAAGTVVAGGRIDLAHQGLVLDLDARLPQLAALSGLVGTPLQGSARWRPHLLLGWSGPLSVEARGPLSAHQLSVQGVVVGQADGPLTLEYGPGGLTLDGDTQLSGLRASGVDVKSGSAQWKLLQVPGGPLTVQADVQAQDLSAAPASVTVSSVAGHVEVERSARGLLRLRTDVQVEGARPLGPGSEVVASGPVHLAMVGDELHAQVALAQPGGEVLLGGQVDGSLAHNGAWTLSDLVVAPLPGLRWEGQGVQRVVLGPGGVAELDVHLVGDAGEVVASRATAGDDLLIQASGLDLKRLVALQQLVGAVDPASALALSGLGRADLRLGLGPRGGLRQVQGEVAVEHLSYDEQLTDVDLRLGVEGEAAAARVSLDLSGGGLDSPLLLTARGTVPFDLAGRTLACGDGLDLRVVLPPVRQGLLADHILAVPAGDARVSADLHLYGDPCDPELHLVAAGTAAAGRDGQVVRADIILDRVGDQLSVKSFLEQGFRRRLQVTGTAHTSLGTVFADLLDGRAPTVGSPDDLVDTMSLSVVPLDFALADLGAFVDLPPTILGRLVGGFQLTGSPSAPQVGGALQIIQGSVGGVQLDSGVLVLMPAPGGYQISLDASMRNPNRAAPELASSTPLHLGGFVPLDLQSLSRDQVLSSPGLDLTVQGQIPLALSEGLVVGVSDAHGVVDIDGHVTGSLGAPLVIATASTEGAGLTYSPLGLIYDDISLDLRLGGDTLDLVKLSVHDRKRFSLVGRQRALRDTHTLEASGAASLDGFRPRSVQARVSLDDFWLIADRDHQLALAGQTTLAGDWPNLRVRGDLSLASSELHFGEDAFIGDRSLEIDPSIRIDRGEDVAAAPAAVILPPLVPWRQFDIDVGLDLLRNLRLSVEVPQQESFGQQVAALSTIGLDADLGGQIRVLQGDGNLALQGEVETLRGTATVLGVPFDVRGGTISFLGDGYDNPLVDIDAVRHTGGYGDVTVHVSGFVKALNIDPSSEDYPDKTDVVTLLLFGKPASELADSEGQAGSQAVAMALSTLTGQMEKAVGTSVFDELQIDPAGAVRVGWALSSRIFLRLEARSTSDSSANRTEVTLEYLISRRLYAQFVTGDRAASSVDLFWRWRF